MIHKVKSDRQMLAGNIGKLIPASQVKISRQISVSHCEHSYYAAAQVYAIPAWWTEDTGKVGVGCGIWI